MPQNNKAGAASLQESRSTSSPEKVVKSNPVLYGRVFDVLLTADKSKSDDFKVPQGTIGAIKFRFVTNGKIDDNTPLQIATSFSANSRKFPVVNEIVEIVSGPSIPAADAKGNVVPTFYYKDVVNIFDSGEHNALPDISFSEKEGPVTGKGFKERGETKRLQHLPGDIVQESRFGSSIRMGSSNTDYPEAPWSGPSGDPVFLIVNGQRKNIAKSDIITFEDINVDGTVMGMFSTQTVNLIPANYNFDSYEQESQTYSPEQIVKTQAPANTDKSSSNVSSDQVSVKDSGPITPSEPASSPGVSGNEEVEFLPDKEQPIFYQDIENESPRHVSGDNSRWLAGISSDPVSTEDVDKQSSISSFDPYFVAYLIHQQGPSGTKAILYYAKRGYPTVPAGNKFTKEDVQSNMRRNVGSDFKMQLTPGNFVRYWKSKLYSRIKSLTNKRVDFEDVIVKYSGIYGVDVNFAKAVCSIESGFNPTSGNTKYKGLFQLSSSEFYTVYPNDPDILNPDKNSNVGIKVLRRHLSIVSNVLKSIQ